MSYRCEDCGTSTPPNQKLLKRTEYRPVQYDCGSVGMEIVREIKLCPACHSAGLTSETDNNLYVGVGLV